MRDQLSAVSSNSTEPLSHVVHLVTRGASRTVSDIHLSLSATGEALSFQAARQTAPCGQRVMSLIDRLQSIGGPGAPPIRLHISGDLIICVGPALATLAHHNLLESAATHCNLGVLESEFHNMRAELDSHSSRHHLASWIDGRIHQIRRRLASGDYALKPLAGPLEPSPEGEAFVRSVVQPCHDEASLVWIDGRFSESASG